ncbi:VPA1262 family N-terminal domain-containing protein [Methylobacterium sp. 190mf]|uniref:VPA1262 family N-terminal domain-containing protein n=1 Tax=Methylobacterium sp. 190mf TaxID=1761798 RepID=UPI0011AFD3CC|nr:VPA1262 family N-terminal domain-containing protein [Methylobacterium sp. 190mf]
MTAGALEPIPSPSTQLDGRGAAYARLREQLRPLLEHGRIGQFDHVELIEITATPRGAQPLNVLSLAVLAEGRPDVSDADRPQFPIPRIRVDGFRDWSFGVARTLRPLPALDRTLENYAQTGVWGLSGCALQVGALWPEPPMFAPPDGSVAVPLNRVLKNNFWAGSYVFRLLDRQKLHLTPFFADRRRLQQLSEAVSAAVPIAFAGLADLLGDVLIQVPVTVVVPSVAVPRDGDHLRLETIWRPGTLPRALTAAARAKWDELLTGAAVSERLECSGDLAVDGRRRPVESEVLDVGSGALLIATAPTSVLRQITLNSHMLQHEPRLFSAADHDDVVRPERVGLIATTRTVVGEDPGQDADFWLGRRQEMEERRRLEETRDFVQYRPAAGSSAERARALADIRFLIARHGEGGVDLWDPYLTAADLLQTLFWCPHGGVLLRGLSGGSDPPRVARPGGAEPGSVQPPPASFADRQRVLLARDGGNLEGLRLEYRNSRGPGGWAFHDRFLIFPNGPDGPLAWSLGTSVNSLGNAHHILQRVSNPALIAGAFQDLWSAVDQPEHVVWRSW